MICPEKSTAATTAIKNSASATRTKFLCATNKNYLDIIWLLLLNDAIVAIVAIRARLGRKLDREPDDEIVQATS